MPTGKSHIPGPLSQAMATVLSEAIPYGMQARVARASGISAAQLSRVLKGEKVLRLEELDQICMVLGLEIANVVALADRASANRGAPPASVVSLGDRRDVDGLDGDPVQELVAAKEAATMWRRDDQEFFD